MPTQIQHSAAASWTVVKSTDVGVMTKLMFNLTLNLLTTTIGDLRNDFECTRLQCHDGTL